MSNLKGESILKLSPPYYLINIVFRCSFEDLIIFLREKRVINVTRAGLQRLHLLSTFRHGSPPAALTPKNVNVKVFLAAYMIAYRPSHVFESIGPLEKSLRKCAEPMLVTFERIAKLLISNPSFSFRDVPAELSKPFPMMIFEYLRSFKLWKVPDEAKLTCRIKHALIALYNAEGQLPPDEPEDSKLKVEFFTQIERLRSKLQQIAGIEELNNFDVHRATGQVSLIAPSGVTDLYASIPGRMSNEQLAHELLLDPKFQLDEAGGASCENPIYHRIREGFNKAFWDSLVDDLKLFPPCYVRLLRVVVEIRDGLGDILGGKVDNVPIEDVINIPSIEQQISAGAVTWEDCKNLVVLILKIILRTQAPRRDDETQKKWLETARPMIAADNHPEDQPQAICNAFEFLLGRLNIMRVDCANTRLRLIAPVIMDHGVEYERNKFQDKLNDGTMTLARTEVCTFHVSSSFSTQCVDDLLSRPGFIGSCSIQSSQASSVSRGSAKGSGGISSLCTLMPSPCSSLTRRLSSMILSPRPCFLTRVA